jgi:hypothetical protein
MRHRALIAILGLSAWSAVALAGNASANSSSSSSHPAAMQLGSVAHMGTGGAMRNTATARSIIGESTSSFLVTKQSLMGHTVELTSFSSPRPLTGPERRQLNHAGYVATRVTQENNDMVYYCRRSLDVSNALDCFGPERGH